MSATDRIAAALSISDTNAARLFAEQVRQAVGNIVPYKYIAQTLEELDPRERTVLNVVARLYSQGTTQSEHSAASVSKRDKQEVKGTKTTISKALIRFGVVLGVNEHEAQQTADNFRAKFPLPITDAEFLDAAQRASGKPEIARHIAENLIVSIIARELSIGRIEAAEFSFNLGHLLGIPVNNKDIVFALAALGSQASEATLLAYFKEQAAPFAELASLLAILPADAYRLTDHVRALLPVPVSHEDLMAAVRPLNRGERTESNIVEQLTINTIARELSVNQQEIKELSVLLTDSAHRPIGYSEILDTLLELGNNRTKTALISYFKDVTAIAQLAMTLRVSPDEARQVADELRAKFPLPLSYQEVLEAVQGPDSKARPAHQVREELILNAIARELSITREEASEIAPSLTYLTRMPVDNRMILSALAELGNRASEAALLTHFKEESAPFLELADALSVNPEDSLKVADRIRANFPLPVTHEELLIAMRKLDPSLRTKSQIVDQLEADIISKELSISPEAVAPLSLQLSEITRESISKRQILLTLNELGEGANEDSLKAHFQETSDIKELAQILGITPEETQTWMALAAGKVPYSLSTNEILAAARNVNELPPTISSIFSQLEVEALAKAFGIEKTHAKELTSKIEQDSGYPITAEELLKQQAQWQSVGRSVNTDELAAAWYVANKYNRPFHDSFWSVRDVRRLTHDRASCEDVLASYKASTTDALEEVAEIADAIALANSMNLVIHPTELREYIRLTHTSKDYPFTIAELLESARCIIAPSVSAERAEALLEIKTLARAFAIDEDRAALLVNEVETESKHSITAQAILKEVSQWKATGRHLLVEELPLASHIAHNGRMPLHDAIHVVRDLMRLGGDGISYSEVLTIYRTSDDKDPMRVAIKLREISLAKTLGVSVDRIPDLLNRLTKEIGRRITLEEIADIVNKLEDQATPEGVKAWYRRQAQSILTVAEILGTSPQHAYQAIEEVQGATGHNYSAEEIRQIAEFLPPDVRTVERIIDEFHIHQLAEELGYQTQALRLLVATITEEIGSKPDFELLAEAIAVSQDLKVLPGFYKHPVSEDSSPTWIIAWEYQSLTNVVTLLRLSKSLGKRPNQLGQLWRDAERQCSKPLDLQMFATLVERLPNSVRNTTGITQWFSLANLFHVDPGDSSVIQEFYTSFPKKTPTRRFWALCKAYKEVEGVSIHDMQYVQKLSSWSQASSDLILPNMNKGEQPITSQTLAEVGRKRTRRKGNIKSLANLAQRSWDQICSDKRAYAVPSQGRAEIITSKRIQDMWGLNALRFVQEGIDAPKVFVQFKFGEPARIGIMCIEDGDTDSGFLMMSEDLWLRAFFRAIALTYYRDMVLPGFTYVPTSTHLSRSRNSVVDTQSPREQRNVLPRSHAVQREKVYQFYEWHAAQERARHSVTGHVRWVHKGFVADVLKHQQARRAGVQLSLGYTWVVEHERGNPQREDGVALNEDYDLLRYTLFAAPTRATIELEALF